MDKDIFSKNQAELDAVGVLEKPAIEILLIEESEAFASLIQDFLSLQDLKDYKVQRVKSISEINSELVQKDFNILLVGFSEEENSCSPKFDQIREKFSTYPIVAFIDSYDVRLERLLLQYEVQDCLIKNRVNQYILVKTINYAIERYQVASQLKEKTRDLELSEARMRKVISKNVDGMFILDKERFVYFSNPAAKQIFAIEEGKRLRSSLEFPLVVNQNTEIDIIPKSGMPKSVEIRLVEIEWQGKEAYLASFRDITERKRLEQKKKELIKEVEKQNETLNDFAHIISHDLRNPLCAARLLVAWLASDMKKEEKLVHYERCQLVIKKIDYMVEMITGILSYSKLGGAPKEPASIEVNRLIEEVIDLISPVENITFKRGKNFPILFGDAIKLKQVFQNLIGNAVKYMDKVNGKVEIGCFVEEEFFKFFVSDNGPGISEKDQSKIFEIFQTLKHENKVDSLGIGLAIVKKIVEDYQGKIWVESNPNQGSSFYFTLPKSMQCV